ncbi:hypothetical protein HOLleu_25452 [Holothuria leucospilota]|uniref:Reverse transcriptase domain-containing protein n=1 Tax=Holothuria leucospilota TaxID=206669 RepID=A0A9Q1BSG5_HOLLE|nr:hypothetical protein HOLleu_25452 [Holothuria leucospilota]
MERGLIRLDGGPVAQETKFGWVVSGSWKGNTAGTHGVNCAHQLVCLNDVPELDFQRICEIEENGVGPIETGNKCIDPVWQNFQNAVSYIKDEGRCEVSLPWKNEYVASRLLNNEKLAKRRLGALSKRLSRNSELHEAYDKALLDMEQDGIIEEVPTNELCTSNPVFYLPHRPMVRDSSLTTKVRPVFDASAKGFNNLSLNDCLEAGPCLLGNLVEILIRFRRWPIAITADITKAFLQIKVRKQDQDVHRFLWTHEGETRVMRFVRVPFGNKSSPFLLNATVKYHLSNYPPSAAKTELEENLYCDDLLTGADTAKEGYALFKDCDQIMISAGMTFAKLTSNNVEMSEIFFQEFQTKYLDVQSLKILGLKWIAKLDYFSYDGVEVPADIVVTKRVVLSCIARMFDPLGFLNPFLMTIKIMFQDLWTLGISWDEEIPENYSKRFWEWVAGLKLIQNWHIPRCYVNSEWKKLHNVENPRRQISDRVVGSDLSHEELMNAKVVMFRCIQKEHYFMEFLALRKNGSVPNTSPIASLNPYLADDEILRIKGRLQLSELSYEEKHPVILPKCHLSLLLVRHQHKLLNHAGVDTLVSTLRSGYWIVGLRRQAKRVKESVLLVKGRVAGFVPSGINVEVMEVNKQDLTEREIVSQTRLDEFWAMWSKDYLRNLPPALKEFVPRCNLKACELKMTYQCQHRGCLQRRMSLFMVANFCLHAALTTGRSYVTSNLVKRVRPEWVSAQPLAYAVFGGNKTSGCKLRDVYKLGLQSTVKGIKGDSATESLTEVEVPVICKPIRRTEVPCDFLKAFGNLGFADGYGTSRDVKIDVLIRQDFCWNFIERGLIRLDGGPVDQETKFGWVVGGSWKGNTAGTHGVNCTDQLVCLNDVPELDFQRIWEIEEIGVGPIETGNKCIDPVWENFQNSVSYINDEGRYEVSVPWKNKYVASRLLNNEKLAKGRLGAFSKTLSRNSELHEAYNKVLLDMEQDGIIEEVPTNELCTSNPVFYLPHRPVVRDSSLTTKVRPVFEASAKGFNNTSLNDCLEAGPCLLGNLVEILIRFRRWPIAITADITKVFLQIKVRKQDQDVHRFLWNHEGEYES